MTKLIRSNCTYRPHRKKIQNAHETLVIVRNKSGLTRQFLDRLPLIALTRFSFRNRFLSLYPVTEPCVISVAHIDALHGGTDTPVQNPGTVNQARVRSLRDDARQGRFYKWRARARANKQYAFYKIYVVHQYDTSHHQTECSIRNCHSLCNCYRSHRK